jgi:hypothetical protein
LRRQTRVILSAAIVAVLLCGLYGGLRGLLRQHDARVTDSAIFKLSISTPKPDAKPLPLEDSPVFKAAEGQTVTLLISSEQPGSLHVHGYEKEIDLAPGREVALTFQATVAGRFPVHLHHPEPDSAMDYLATLEVQPK